MTLFEWAVVAKFVAVTGTGLPTAAPPPPAPPVRFSQVTQQRELQPRVEIGEAMLIIYDASGRVVAVE